MNWVRVTCKKAREVNLVFPATASFCSKLYFQANIFTSQEASLQWLPGQQKTKKHMKTKPTWVCAKNEKSIIDAGYCFSRKKKCIWTMRMLEVKLCRKGPKQNKRSFLTVQSLFRRFGRHNLHQKSALYISRKITELFLYNANSIFNALLSSKSNFKLHF